MIWYNKPCITMSYLWFACQLVLQWTWNELLSSLCFTGEHILTEDTEMYKKKHWWYLLTYVYCLHCDMLLLVLTEFIEGVSQFSVKGDKLSKLRCRYIIILCMYTLSHKYDTLLNMRCTIVQSAVLRWSHVFCPSLCPSIWLWRWWIVIT